MSSGTDDRPKSGKREAAWATFVVGLALTGWLFSFDDADKIRALSSIVATYVGGSILFLAAAHGFQHLTNMGAFWR